MHRAGCLLSDHDHVLLPHVGADELQSFDRRFRHGTEEPSQALFGSIAGDAQKTATVGIDLVDQRQVFVATAVSDLIDADRLDVPDFSVDKASADDPLDGSVDGVPARSKDGRGLFPAQPLRPGSEENAIAVSAAVLAVSPRDLLDFHTACRAVDSPHRVHEEHGDAPQRHEFESSLAASVVTGTFLVTTAADRSTATVWLEADQDRGLVFVKTHRGVDKALCFST